MRRISRCSTSIRREEAFCTGTFAGLTPIRKVDGRPFARGADPADASGPLTVKLRALYKALEREEARGRA